MDVTITQYKRCNVITASGRIDSNTAPQLEEALNSILDDGHFKIVIDMTNVSFISSKGLWVIIEAQKKCKRYNRGEVVLVNVQKNIMEALSLVGLEQYYKIFDDITSAVGSF